MLHTLQDSSIPLRYDEVYREYSIGLPDASVSQTVDYCPFCGAVLPVSLRDQLGDEMEARLGEDADFFKDRERMPIEFQSDAWWQGRYDDTGERIA